MGGGREGEREGRRERERERESALCLGTSFRAWVSSPVKTWGCSEGKLKRCREGAAKQETSPGLVKRFYRKGLLTTCNREDALTV